MYNKRTRIKKNVSTYARLIPKTDHIWCVYEIPVDIVTVWRVQIQIIPNAKENQLRCATASCVQNAMSFQLNYFSFKLL